ncbi:MAG: hypothetical protein ACYCPS_02105 [Candidatus Saccharimonadales bacterium]
MLASKLVPKYRYENCSVLILDDGGAVIGSEIAQQLHCGLNMMLTQEIDLPLEPLAIGGLTQAGDFVYNSQYSEADLEEMTSENRGYIEQQRLAKFHDLNRMIGDAGVIDRSVLAGHNIILTSEGIGNSLKLDMARSFVKVVRYEKIIVATPIASVSSVDWMHVFADEIYCLSVVEELAEVNHYYDVYDVPKHDDIPKLIKTNILSWK